VCAGVPAGCQCPKCRNRVGFDEPGGSTWRGGVVGRGLSSLGTLFGKKGDDQLRLRVAPSAAGALADAAGSPWRTDVIGAVKTRSDPPPSTGHAASRPASPIERDTSNSSPHERQQNA
jgi:hypothetical protein